MKRVIMCCVLLMGCSDIKTVYVPVSSCPVPPVLSMPSLEVNKLSNKPETSIALKALLADHIVLKNNLEQCLTIVDGYRSSPTDYKK